MKLRTSIDMLGNEIKQGVAERVGTLPETNLFAGRMVVLITPGESGNPDTGVYYYYNGTTWISVIESSFISIDSTKFNVIDNEVEAHTFDTITEAANYIRTSNSNPKSLIIGSETSLNINNEPIPNGAFSGCVTLKHAILPNNIHGINQGAFSGCTALEDINIPTAAEYIANGAFSGCESLKGISIPSNTTSIGSSAFSGCLTLKTINIPNTVTSFGDAIFAECRYLKSVNIGTGITIIPAQAFANCVNIESVSIPASVTTIGSAAFSGCANLKSVTLRSGLLTIAAGAFSGCKSLSTITIPATVTDIGTGAFSDCGLVSISLPKALNTIGGAAFSRCTKLVSVTIPEEVTINTNIFSGCDILALDTYKERAGYPWGATNILIQNEDVTTTIDENSTDRQVPTAKTVYNALSNGIIDETKINVIDDEITLHTFDTLSDAKFYIDSNNKPKSVIIGSNANITSIGEYAFSDCTSLTYITIPNSVTSIDYSAFENCTSLTSITIPNSVTSIGNTAFSNCTSLTSITIPNSVTSIEDTTFSNCTSLTDITIPNSVTSIGKSAFYNCTSLTYIIIPNGVTSIISRTFYNCTSLTYITIPNSVTSIGEGVFENCTSLTSITIPNSVTSIGEGVFENCTSLTSITIPNKLTNISSHAFENCTSLTSITIPNSVTSISGYAFSNCTSLTSITIPNGVTGISEYVFKGCKSLTSITIPNSVTGISINAFSGCDILLLDNYKSREGYPWGATNIYIQNEDVTTTIDDSSTDRQVPTAKAVKSAVDSVEGFSCFHGTTAQWEALTDEQKAEYDYVDLTDETDACTPVDAVEADNMNPVTSNAVNTAIEEVTIPTQALESLGIRNMAPGQTGCKHIAHRGVYVAPENTVVGMQAAKAYGFDFVEFDVKWSKDDVPICIHDNTVDRVTNNEYTGNVVDFTYDELKQMDVGKYKNPENSDIYTGTTIPDLNRMLICCRMLRLHPYIEIHTTSPKWTAEKVKQCVDKVKELHMERDVTWICSNTTWLKEVLKEDPSARVGWATSTFSTQAHIDTLLELKTPYNEIFLDFASDDTVSGSQEATNTAAQLCRDNDIPFEVFCSTSGHQGCLDEHWYCTGSTSDRFRMFDQQLSANNTVFNPIWGTGDDMSFPQYANGTWHEYCVSPDRHILSVGRVIDTYIDFIWNGPNTGGTADHTEYTIFSPLHNTMEMKCVPRYDKYFTIMGIKDDDPTTPHWFALLKICGKLSETPGDIVMLYNNAPTGCHFRHTIFYAI